MLVVLPTRGDGGPEQFKGVGTSTNQLDTGRSRRDFCLKVPQIIAAHLWLVRRVVFKLLLI